MKYLICGVGSIGLRHLKNLKFLGHNDIILYTTGKSLVPGYLEATKDLDKYSDIDKALAQNPDVCMITNPTSLHISTAIKAAENNCHLFIEKPLSHNLEGLGDLLKITEDKRLISFITYQFRYHPHVKILKDIFKNNRKTEYGKPLYVTSEWSEYLPDWHPWENYKEGYSARNDLGGGVLLTQIHPVNYINYIFGEIDKITVNKASTKSLGIDVDDVADLLISFINGLTGHVHIDFLQKPRVHTMKIVTDMGRFEWDYHENRLVFLGSNGDIINFENDGFDRNDMFIDMLSDFIDCVKNKKETKFNLKSAIKEMHQLIG
ncbi:MAG: hypothetical protein CVV49_03520 [Spirochaetae bacterium HGW-Spirochaetae-5]|nr:MAG: hypothetical protein CVV49_03520 [Spirochaetae bacterium HGW-Spirochaetae-5]